MQTPKLVAIAIMAVIAWLSVTTTAYGQLSQSSQPRLVVLLVVDQFNYEYLSRYSDKFGASGFRYLQEHGASFTNCRYKQATTQTAVGHSVIASGAYPWSTGVVANEWYDRRKSGEVTSVSDDTTQLVGGTGASVGGSAKAMLGTTFGDQLKLSSNGRSKIIALSLKDRGALFLAGKFANGAYWFDSKSGGFVSSSQFGVALPSWVKTFNDKRYADSFFGKQWQRLHAEPVYTASVKDDYTFEGANPGDGKQFPHVITGGASAPNESYYNAFMASPFGDQMLAELTKEAIEQEALGQHTDTDMLAVSFSSPDKVGHLYGPQSQEAEDEMLRLDQTIGALLQYLDRKIGLSRCVVVVSGDHGVMPVPEFLRERGQSRGLDAGRIDPKAFKTLLNSAMNSRLGPGDWISAFYPPNLYLNLAEVDKQKYRQPEVEALAAKLAHSIPGVAAAYTANQLYTNQMPNGPFTDAVRKSYYWGRSGELYILPRPGYIFASDPTGTSHGSPYAYDQQVPLIIMGTGITGGRYGHESSPADIAPTMSAILGLPMPPLCEGRVLQEALGQFAGPPVPMR